jgi:hypothetical protein
MKNLVIIGTAALIAVPLLSTPSQADKIKAGQPAYSGPVKKDGSQGPNKSIEGASGGPSTNPGGGGQSGGIKSSPINPVTVTFPSQNSRAQPGNSAARSPSGPSKSSGGKR